MIGRTSEPARHAPAGPAAVVALVVGFLALTLGPVLGGIDHFPEKSIDMDRNHVPVVRTFAAEWPSPDLVEYDSATTPGMHLLMAAVVRFVGDSETTLQVLSVSFGLLLVLVACRFSSRVVPLAVAVACTLPLALSPYTIGNSIWVMTDNLSLALVAVTMGVAIFQRPTIASSAVSGVALVAAVLSEIHARCADGRLADVAAVPAGTLAAKEAAVAGVPVMDLDDVPAVDVAVLQPDEMTLNVVEEAEGSTRLVSRGVAAVVGRSQRPVQPDLPLLKRVLDKAVSIVLLGDGSDSDSYSAASVITDPEPLGGAVPVAMRCASREEWEEAAE